MRAYADYIERVAQRFKGSPTETKANELRFGSKGSLSVMVGGPKKGTWYDHEKKKGGGTLDLVVHLNGCRNRSEALKWMRETFKIVGKTDLRYDAIYDYTDERGELIFQVCRHLTGGRARFTQRQPDGKGGWIDDVKGVEQVPYGLRELVEAPDETVFVVEGEKDADNLADLGFVATCNAGGAGKWPEDLTQWFKGRDVVIVPDNDDAGRSHAQLVGRALSGTAARIRVLQLPDLPEKGDVSDWIEDGGTAREFERLVDDAPDWTPEAGIDHHDATPDNEIAALNSEYAVVLAGEKTAVLHEHPDIDGRPSWGLMSIGSFHNWLANRFIQIGKKPEPLSKHWLTHPQRRQYEGIVFVPGRIDPSYYNVWRGFALKPREGDCELFLDHVFVNVCRRDRDLYRWVMAWCANIVQQPEKKMGTSLSLRGPQGSGKTFFGKTIGSLMGPHYVLVADPRYITGRFNSHLVSCLMLHADEGFWAGDRSAEGKLRDLITGDVHPIEMKGVEPFHVRNYVRLLVTGNPNWLVPAAMDERRFAVLDMGEEHCKDHEYFGAIEARMNDGGREALLDHLLHFDLSRVNLREIPKTEALLDQKIASMPSEHAWWLDLLMSGVLPSAAMYVPKGWDKPPKGFVYTSRRALFDSYLEHASDVGVRRRSIETAIGLFLRKAVPGLRELQKQQFNAPDGRRYQSRAYVLPPLAECREAFEKTVNQDIDWADEATEDWILEEVTT